MTNGPCRYGSAFCIRAFISPLCFHISKLTAIAHHLTTILVQLVPCLRHVFRPFSNYFALHTSSSSTTPSDQIIAFLLPILIGIQRVIIASKSQSTALLSHHRRQDSTISRHGRQHLLIHRDQWFRERVCPLPYLLHT